MKARLALIALTCTAALAAAPADGAVRSTDRDARCLIVTPHAADTGWISGNEPRAFYSIQADPCRRDARLDRVRSVVRSNVPGGPTSREVTRRAPHDNVVEVPADPGTYTARMRISLRLERGEDWRRTGPRCDEVTDRRVVCRYEREFDVLPDPDDPAPLP